MMPLLPEKYSRVLEIGCADGRFRDYLGERHEYWGVEPVEAAARVAAARLDKVLVGTYQETVNQLPDDYFDLVICNDVIEHMVDPDGFFQSLPRKIKKGGCVVASIPNVRYLPNLFDLLLKKEWEYKDEGILDRTHLRFFTEKSLRRTVVAHGFVIDQLAGLNPCKMGRGSRLWLNRLAILLLGQDVRFMRFGVRMRYVGPARASSEPAGV